MFVYLERDTKKKECGKYGAKVFVAKSIRRS